MLSARQVIQLPESTHGMAPAPGLQHLRSFTNQVHRQELDVFPSALGVEHEARQATLKKWMMRAKTSPPPPLRHETYQPEEENTDDGKDDDGNGEDNEDNLSSRLQSGRESFSESAYQRAMDFLVHFASFGRRSSSVYFDSYGNSSGSVPLWVWPVVGATAILLAVLGTWLLLRMREKNRMKRAQVEDVQPVFQRETWRKVE